MKRKSFVFYASYYESIKTLSKKQQAILYNAIIEYALFKKEPNLKGVEKMIFVLVQPTLLANITRYENGKLGGVKKEDFSKKSESKRNLTRTETEPNLNRKRTETEPNLNRKRTEIEPKPNLIINDNVNVNNNANVNENENEKMKNQKERKALSKTLSLSQKNIDDNANTKASENSNQNNNSKTNNASASELLKSEIYKSDNDLPSNDNNLQDSELMDESLQDSELLDDCFKAGEVFEVSMQGGKLLEVRLQGSELLEKSFQDCELVENDFQYNELRKNQNLQKNGYINTNLTFDDIKKFKKAFPKRIVDIDRAIEIEYQGRYDIEKLINCIKSSAFLNSADNMSLSSCLKRYEQIISGFYKQITPNSAKKSYERDYLNQEIDELMKALESNDIE